MLSLFPELLFLAPIAVALLRVITGIYVCLIGWNLFVARRTTARETFPLIGHPPAWVLAIATTGFALCGIVLVIGAWTQAVALLAALGCLKLAILSRTHPSLSYLSRNTYLLLGLIALSLVFMGSGALAVDLPL